MLDIKAFLLKLNKIIMRCSMLGLEPAEIAEQEHYILRYRLGTDRHSYHSGTTRVCFPSVS